jgi:hypothetical protein
MNQRHRHLQHAQLSLLTSCTDTADPLTSPTSRISMHTPTSASPNVLTNSHAHTTSVCEDMNISDSTNSDSSYDLLPLISHKMSVNTPAECIHAEPKCIPLLTPGEVSPMVMRQWEMACEDFFSANKKLEEMDRVAAVLPGLKDMRARDWVATHRMELVALPFANFMKDLRKEFLSDGWDDELHACICNARLKPSDSFAKWVNDICHLNIILHDTDYHFSKDALRFQLDSLLDVDLRTRCKNRKIKELVDAAVNTLGEKTGEARLAIWIAETRKLAEECNHDTKHYLEASKDFQHAPKRQALAVNSHALNATSTKPYSSTNSGPSTRMKPPCLTDNECSLLHKHQGCMKCCWGYQNHRASDCPFDFPDPRNYRELTEDILLSQKHGGTTSNKQAKQQMSRGHSAPDNVSTAGWAAAL